MWKKIATCCVCLHNGELVAARGVCKTAGSTPLASKCAEFRTRDSRSPDPSIPSAIERTATWHSLNRTQTPEIRESRPQHFRKNDEKGRVIGRQPVFIPETVSLYDFQMQKPRFTVPTPPGHFSLKLQKLFEFVLCVTSFFFFHCLSIAHSFSVTFFSFPRDLTIII